MKVPSIIKIPKHQRYEVTPRYYDPVKEEIEQRTSRIKAELASQKKGGEHHSAISGTFSTKRTHSEKSSSYFQFILVVDLLGSFIAYLQWGNVALYFLLGSLFFLIYLKMKRIL